MMVAEGLELGAVDLLQDPLLNLVTLSTGPTCSMLPKNPLFPQNLSSQPCLKMEGDKSLTFSSYGLQWCLHELDKEEFQIFKELLKKKSSESTTCSIPQFEIENANVECLALLLHEYYGASLAWATSISIFENMNLPTLSEKARDDMKRHSPEDLEPTTTGQGPSKEEVPGISQAVQQESATAAETKEQEISQAMEQEGATAAETEAQEISQAMEQEGATAAETEEQECGGDKWDYKSHVVTKFAVKEDVRRGFEKTADWPEMQMLAGAFNSDQWGFRPHTVVLHGKSGIGKSALARRIVLCWAQGGLYQGMFSYVFFLPVTEMQQKKETSVAEFISREWPDPRAPVTEIMSRPERLLFIIDGFDDLGSVLNSDTKLCKDWSEKQPPFILIQSLLRKVLLPESFLMVTVRDVGIEKLKSEVVSPRYLFVRGITAEQRIHLLLERGIGEHQKTQGLCAIMNNRKLLDQCQVPAVGSLICVALQLQDVVGESIAPFGQTLTGLYAAFVFHQLTPRGVARRCLNLEERVVLKRFCRMAVEGVWNMKSVFDGDDLMVHGLGESELRTLFHMNILLRDSHCEEFYTFFHLSLQDFCAALYYVLEGLEIEPALCPLFVEKTKRSMELQQAGFHIHLLGMKRFLFGLVSEDVRKPLEVLLGCPVPLGVKQKLLHWVSLLGQQPNAAAPGDTLDAFRCLFETQDKEFVRSALNGFQEVWLPINQNLDLIASSFCLQHGPYLRKIRVDVKGIFPRDELAEAWPVVPQWMRGKTLMEDQWEDFCSVLSTHPHLRQLDLGSSILTERAMKTLCAKLRHPTCKIQTLRFRNAQIASGLQHLWRTLIANRNLRSLNLGGTHLKEEDVRMACEALKHPKCLLESLRLDRCGLTHACYLKISQILTTSPSLKSLSLAGNEVTDQGVTPLSDALRVSQCALQKLTLEDCGITATGCQSLASALISNRSLTHLCLSNNDLGNEGVNLLCRSMRLPHCSLRRLMLNRCNLDTASCGFLALALMGNAWLTHLSLSVNPVEDNGMKLLCEVMREPSCHLQDLELVKCHLTAACCESLSCVISRSRHLQSLDLTDNALGDGGVAALCEGLKQKKSVLTRLGLKACGLTSDCCEALSLALSCNRHLTSLNLVQNNFSPEGMMKLCSAFACPTSNLQIIGLWKWQYPVQIKKLLEEVQLLKPQIVIDGSWHSFDEDDRYWWKN
ncbi:NACHT, LRR and PYD domains-containing protein 5 [Theropithecus gelada]|uniref:NACHT, LRR and PYD domains-containing protein 5 n=1 Tax=Theropithecus gelada TaxID=9565 RepID=UPI000DC17DAB|nr:NACHT, LRR and PYD domains-containing protein 5 [Theropithecus gelada]